MTYSRIERLHFRLFGRWPDRVVERRLAENDQMMEEATRHPEDWWRLLPTGKGERT